LSGAAVSCSTRRKSYPNKSITKPMANQVSEYHRGEMDIHEQAATYKFVMGLTKWGALTTAVVVLFLALWFCTPTGFLGAFVTAVVVAVIGVLLLRGGGGH
jgi:hypothetical protein